MAGLLKNLNSILRVRVLLPQELFQFVQRSRSQLRLKLGWEILFFQNIRKVIEKRSILNGYLKLLDERFLLKEVVIKLENIVNS